MKPSSPRPSLTIDPTFLALFGAESSVRLRAGEILFERGDKAEFMYVVRQGTIRLSVDDRTVEIVEVGGMFGEMAIIDHLDRSATATAMTDTVLAAIDERRFIAMLREAPMFGLNLLRQTTRRLRAMDQLMSDIIQPRQNEE